MHVFSLHPSFLCRYRFLEFRYSRSEGQAWPSVDQMFAKGERWGVAYNENGDHSATSASNNRQSTSTPSSSANVKPAIVAPTSPTVSFKDTTPTEEDADDKAPPHRVVVYFMPDIWSIMPDKGSWESIKAKYQDPKSYCTPKEPTTQSQCSDTGIDKEMDAQGDAESLGKEAEQEMRTSGKDNEAAEAMDTTEDIPRWKTEPVSGSPGQEEVPPCPCVTQDNLFECLLYVIVDEMSWSFAEVPSQCASLVVFVVFCPRNMRRLTMEINPMKKSKRMTPENCTIAKST